MRTAASEAQAARAAARCARPPMKEADHTCEAQPLWHWSGGSAAHRCREFDARRSTCNGLDDELEERGDDGEEEDPVS